MVSLYLSVSVYAEITENQWNTLGDSDRVMLVREELQEVVDLEDQIDHLREIALRKKQVNGLEKRGQQEQIKQLFIDDEAKLKDYLIQKDLAYTILYLEDLKLAYKGTNSVDDQFLFYDALIGFQQKKYTRAQGMLEELLKRYPSSTKTKSSLYTLQSIYIKTDQNEKFLKVYDDYIWDKSIDQQFWYGQVLYNTCSYYDSDSVFQGLTSDPVYGFRAQVMIALITTFTTSPDIGLESFLLLKDSFSPETPYYEIVPLNIARLYSQIGMTELATKYYSYYNNLVSENGRMTSDVKFEIAIMSMNSGDLEMSKALLDDIQSDPYASEYYAACVYLLSTIDYENRSLDESEEIVTQAKEIADLYLDILLAKHKKVNELKNLKTSLFDAQTKDEKLDLISKIQSAEDKISMASEKMLTTASGADAATMRKLWQMENDYIDTVNSTVDEVLKIYMLSQQPNDSRVVMVDSNLLLTDQLYILSLAKKYLLDMPNISRSDLNTALAVATEIYESNKMIQMWNNVRDLVVKSGKSGQIEKIDESVRMLQKNIANLDNEMELRYGDYWNSPDVARAINEELNSLIAERENLLELRKFVAESFNQRLASLLLRRARTSAEKDDVALDGHVETVELIKKDIRTVKSEFDYTIIDLLYIDSIRKDEAFQRARDKQSNTTLGGKVENE
jgi:TolA-binding protein